MRDIQPDLESRGARLVVIGNGTPAMAEDFLKERPLPAELYVDPSLRAYRAAGLRRGLLALINPQIALNSLRAMRAGFRQTGVRGDAQQLGGVLVIAPGDELLFHHVSKVPGDHPEPSAILRAVDRGRARQSKK